MIDSLIIKSEIYRKKENELKEKDDKIEYLSKSIEELKKVINLKNDEIKSLKSKLNIVEDKLNRFNEISKCFLFSWYRVSAADPTLPGFRFFGSASFEPQKK